MKGILTECNSGWVVKYLTPTGEVDSMGHILTKEIEYQIDSVSEFTFPLKEGIEVEFEITEEYVEPPPHIHSNRGGYKKLAKLLAPKKKKKQITFSLDESQVERYEAWCKKIEKKNPKYYGAAGGGYSFIFIPTGIGTIVKIRRDDGEELDLSDVENW